MSAVVLQRGLIMTVAEKGVADGKSKPGVVEQPYRWLKGDPSDTLKSHQHPAVRLTCASILVNIKKRNELKEAFQTMAEKTFTLPTNGINGVVGVLDPDRIRALDLV